MRRYTMPILFGQRAITKSSILDKYQNHRFCIYRDFTTGPLRIIQHVEYSGCVKKSIYPYLPEYLAFLAGR